MLVVLHSTLHRLDAETERGLHFHHKFLIDRAWHRVVAIVGSLWLEQTVPWVLLEALNIDSLGRISDKDLGEDIFGLCRQELGQAVLCIHDFLVQIRRFLVFEGQISAQHGVQDHSTAPNVRFKSMIAISSNHLGSSVAGASTGCLQSLTLFIHVTETKVDNLQLAIEVKQQVFGLEISVANAELVDVVHASQEFLEMLASRSLFQFLVLDN